MSNKTYFDKVADVIADGHRNLGFIKTERDAALERVGALEDALREIIKVSMGRPRSIARAALDKDAGK